MTKISPPLFVGVDQTIVRPASNGHGILAKTDFRSRMMLVARQSDARHHDSEGVENMAQIREVDASAKQRVKQRTKGFQERLPFRLAVANMTKENAIELAPDHVEAL